MIYKNKISDVTRRKIADEMFLNQLWYHGNLSEPDFLVRIFDLKKLHSNDYRFKNAYDDIYQHMVNNTDWDNDWLYNDSRTNLASCHDNIYLKFLELTLHPRTRTNLEEINKLTTIYNKHLANDGFEVVKTDELSGQPIFSIRPIAMGQVATFAKKTEIKKHLNTEYVRGKIDIMNNAVNTDTDVAIGTAKELLETTCKSILKQKKIPTDANWTLSQLLKTTTNSIDFKPKEVEDADKAEKSIKQILGGISSIVQGVSELRNNFGTGHGKDADFKPLEVRYAKLLVGVVSEIVILYLSTNGEAAELVE